MGKRTPSDLFGAYVEYMKVMFSNLFLLNGGAAIAFLAFLGDGSAGADVDRFVEVGNARSAIMCFAFGAAAAIVATLVAAFLENRNADRLEHGRGFATSLGLVSALFIGASVCLFVYACAIATGAVDG